MTKSRERLSISISWKSGCWSQASGMACKTVWRLPGGTETESMVYMSYGQQGSVLVKPPDQRLFYRSLIARTVPRDLKTRLESVTDKQRNSDWRDGILARESRLTVMRTRSRIGMSRQPTDRGALSIRVRPTVNVSHNCRAWGARRG